MYVDKPLAGVAAVQTLSRLNRIHKLKSQDDVFVLDFANEADDIQARSSRTSRRRSPSRPTRTCSTTSSVRSWTTSARRPGDGRVRPGARRRPSPAG